MLEDMCFWRFKMIISSYEAWVIKEIFAFFATDQPKVLLTKILNKIPKSYKIP